VRSVADVVVAGAGPAGRVIAWACAERGLRVVLVAPHPAAAWPATYGLWLDEARLLPPGAGYVVARARVTARSTRWLAREYAVLDNASVQAAFAHPRVEVRAGRLADVLDLAPVVIDATGAVSAGVSAGDSGRAAAAGSGATADADGAARGGGPGSAGSGSAGGGAARGGGPGGSGGTRSGGARSGGAATARRAAKAGVAEQTAFGVKVAASVARPVVGPGEAVFMDWRQPMPGPATFLYAVPLPDGRVLLEETSLARRPGLPFAQLRERLFARLAAEGIDAGDAEVERVRIPLAPPLSRHGLTFGAAAGMVHPATGYGVGDALRLAPVVADAIARGERQNVVRSARARGVRRLRRAGLATLLSLAPEEHADFFELFFALPEHRQRAYLSGREDLTGNAAAMAAMFRAAPWSLRRRMALRR